MTWEAHPSPGPARQKFTPTVTLTLRGVMKCVPLKVERKL
ncbi:hypothetical protein SBA3_4050006 [Candidatus Sulfopaludibacter sp. SbA3]|nr:hypothetical protein SBA3_4050006 [Candidatus Sulfopaludibacter sp. SbA3]